MTKNLYTSIGLMSGTSMDGIDLAMITSDGKNIIKDKKFAYFPYPNNIKESLKQAIHQLLPKQDLNQLEKDLTLLHANFTNDFLNQNNIDATQIDVIAFHGHTILHKPEEKITIQIGDANLLQNETGIKVIKEFRTFDIENGGQGAPLVPIYHFYILPQDLRPSIILNIGGVSNITYIPSDNEEDMQASDICFGNAPMDDLVQENLGQEYDKDGQIASKGTCNTELAEEILKHEIFSRPIPKAFDRNEFTKILAPIKDLDLSDALKTLSYIHAQAIARSTNPNIKAIYACGGGRKNPTILKDLQAALGQDIKVRKIEDLNLNGDAIEAEAFAFLAIRMIKKLPISFQKTTGISPGIDYALAFSRY